MIWLIHNIFLDDSREPEANNDDETTTIAMQFVNTRGDSLS